MIEIKGNNDEKRGVILKHSLFMKMEFFRQFGSKVQKEQMKNR